MDLTKSPSDPEYRRDLIREIVTAYERAHPNALAETVVSVKQHRASRLNAFASDKQKELRWALRIPGGLFRSLDRLIINPVLFSDDREFNWFMKAYPQYRIGEKT